MLIHGKVWNNSNGHARSSGIGWWVLLCRYFMSTSTEVPRWRCGTPSSTTPVPPHAGRTRNHGVPASTRARLHCQVKPGPHGKPLRTHNGTHHHTEQAYLREPRNEESLPGLKRHRAIHEPPGFVWSCIAFKSLFRCCPFTQKRGLRGTRRPIGLPSTGRLVQLSSRRLRDVVRANIRGVSKRHVWRRWCVNHRGRGDAKGVGATQDPRLGSRHVLAAVVAQGVRDWKSCGKWCQAPTAIRSAPYASVRKGRGIRCRAHNSTNMSTPTAALVCATHHLNNG